MPFVARTLALCCALSLAAACGKKPEPKLEPPPRPDPGARVESGPAALPSRTAGGVTLGDAPQAVIDAALSLATQRARAVNTLIEAGDDARDVALALLDSLNFEELRGALDYFAAVPHPGAGQRIGRLLQHDAATVRDSARRALEGLAADRGAGADARIAGVIDALASDRAALRADAARTLGGLGATSAAPQLARLLTDPDPEVASEAAVALARLGGGAESAPIREAIEAILGDEDAALHALEAALLVARRRGLEVPGPILEGHLSSHEPRRVAAAARALDAAPPGAWRDLFAAAFADARPAVRRAAIEGAVRRAGEAPGALVERAAKDSDASVRVAAAGLIARRGAGSGATIPQLAALLGDPSPLVRRAAIAHLRGFDGGEGPISARLDVEADEDTVALALFGLAGTGRRAALEAVADRLEHPGTRAIAVAALSSAMGTHAPGSDPAAWRALLSARLGGGEPAEGEAPSGD